MCIRDRVIAAFFFSFSGERDGDDGVYSCLLYTSVNQLAANGMPFRDAYKKVGREIEAGEFKPNKDICLLYTSPV